MKWTVSSRPKCFPCPPPKHENIIFPKHCLMCFGSGLDTGYWSSLWKDITHHVLIKFHQNSLQQKLEQYILRTLNLFYAFFWVIPQSLNFVCRRFGTHCLFHLRRRIGMKNDWVWECWVIYMGKWGITQKKAYSIQHTAKVWNQESLNLLVGPAGVTGLWMLGALMWPYFSRTLPVSSQPEISPHQELSEQTEQETELPAPPRPGTD